jgi:hypothetical protein
MTNDKHIEIARIQKEIDEYIGMGPNTLVFNYHDDENKMVKLDVITINPRHNQSFLFKSTTGYDKVDALKNMLEYVKNYKEKDSSYTLQWTLKGESNLHTSYFSAKNVLEAIDKLYYDRDPNSIIIFSVILNPLA